MKILGILIGLVLLAPGCSSRSEGVTPPAPLSKQIPGFRGDPYAYDTAMPPRRNYLPRHHKGYASQSSAGGAASTGNGLASENTDAGVGIGGR
jgi:hypothetical protein